MNRFFRKAILFAVIMGSVCVACKDKDNDNKVVELPTVEVSNSELKSLLMQKGFPFDELGKLVMHDSLLNLATLDFSGLNIDNPEVLTGLSVFPKLEELNLANNKFVYAFDVSKLPANVNKINLAGNEIYELHGLIDVEVAENGDETVTLRKQFKKLYLPQSAKYNCFEVVYFFEQNKTQIDAGEVDFKIENSNGQLSQYNTLREVPDNSLRTVLKRSFAPFFEGDSIDIGKRIVDAAATTKSITWWNPSINSVEGAQYILHHRDFRGGGVSLMLQAGNVHTVMPYLKVPSSVTQIQMEHVDTPNGIDFSNAKKLFRVYIYNNTGIKTVDLNGTTFGLENRTFAAEFAGTSNSLLNLEACTALQDIVFPEGISGFSTILLYDLPALKKLDLKRFNVIHQISLALLPVECPVIYPELSRWVYSYSQDFDSERGKTSLAIRKDIAYRTETKNFIRTYRSHLECTFSTTPMSGRITYDPNGEEESYFWTWDTELLDSL